ncbi:hypothetical protein BHF71_03515 [Vulcanibacillus modesticaldus]|uniref:Uncharacterized protein n=1 Tax=Vulcanibacillus modesticaldus TaxID=337097 RepID=A0A1D2YSW4_9BACI|nr:hypothetical protein [Vulcanibacillus modesticaldus]OEF98097.1 hypothetical protein BHF71_03515 [Vulcanibacillus modesticaldus]
MPKFILDELNNRIDRLRSYENQIGTTEEEKNCIQIRRAELESIRNFINESINHKEEKRRNTHEFWKDFWKLVDEF